MVKESSDKKPRAHPVSLASPASCTQGQPPGHCLLCSSAGCPHKALLLVTKSARRQSCLDNAHQQHKAKLSACAGPKTCKERTEPRTLPACPSCVRSTHQPDCTVLAHAQSFRPTTAAATQNKN
jgi:hypothetical protein